MVHCLVEFSDGSVLAQMAEPDMRMPIAQSLYWPERTEGLCQRIGFEQQFSLSFEPIDIRKFPAFALARDAMQRGGGAPAVLNGANEAAVAAFLNNELRFLDIATTVAETMERADKLALFEPVSDIDAALEIDARARELARDVMGRLPQP
jgi:1-deoxy-D-xylulose-5-phosphate reductoisomerase